MNSTLLENGLDFILLATKFLKESEENIDEEEKSRNIKYSLINLLSGVELVMKARLYAENWAYIFADIDKARKSLLSCGEFNTVDCSRCIDRLENLCEVKISDADKKAFDNLRKKRNCVEHYIPMDSCADLSSTINQALTATVHFLDSTFSVFSSPDIIDLSDDEFRTLSEKEKNLYSDITVAISSLNEHYNIAKSIATKRACEQGSCLEEDLVLCPNCNERTLVINDEDNSCHCYLCNYKSNGEDAAKDYLYSVYNINEYETVKYGGDYPLYNCPECGENSFIQVDNNYMCFSCRQNYCKNEIGFCEECGRPYIILEGKDIKMCPDCYDYIMEKIEKA